MRLTIEIAYVPVSPQGREDFIDDIRAVCEEYEADMSVDSED